MTTATTNELTLETVTSYASEANLRRALARTGLDTHGCRYMVVRTPEGRWTAIFMATEWLRANGGYVGFAAQHGFMSV